MNTKYFPTLIAIALATGLNHPVTYAQTSQSLLTFRFSNVLVQRSSLIPNQLIDLATPPPPVDGRPDERDSAGTRCSTKPQLIINLLHLAISRCLS